jgi:hypothetical protein
MPSAMEAPFDHQTTVHTGDEVMRWPGVNDHGYRNHSGSPKLTGFPTDLHIPQNWFLTFQNQNYIISLLVQ